MGIMKLFEKKDTKHDEGRLQIVTEKPFYEPGDEVEGHVYIRVDEDMECEDIKIEIKGGQTLAFERFWQEAKQRDGPEGPETYFEEEHEKMKDKDVFMAWKEKVYEVPDETLKVGDYSIKFKF